MVLKPVAVLTSNYLRSVGLPQSVHIGTGYKHSCDKSVSKSDNKSDSKSDNKSDSKSKIKTDISTSGTGSGSGNNENMHILSRPIYPGKVRFGFIPDEWFTFFYSKTGLTGPYMFGLGLLNFLFSKEIYVCEHEFYSGLSLGAMCIYVVKKFGPSVASYCDKEIDNVEKQWKQMHESEIKQLQDLIEDEKKEQWRAEGSLLLIQLKKQNIAMQLDAAYRAALMNVYTKVKHQLDYQVACRNVEIRINHKHMVTWIMDQVEAALPKSDEKTTKKQRSDLSAMALRIK